MHRSRRPVPEAPIDNRLVSTLIQLFEQDPDATVTEAEAQGMFQAVPGCLRELLTYRELLGHRYAKVWIEGSAEAAPNVIRLPDNRGSAPLDPRGAA